MGEGKESLVKTYKFNWSFGFETLCMLFVVMVFAGWLIGQSFVDVKGGSVWMMVGGTWSIWMIVGRTWST